MPLLALILSITSGFALMRYRLPPLTTAMTSLIVDLSLAPITVIIAHRRSRSPGLWTLLGLAFGAWALAWVLIFPLRRSTPTPDNGHPSQAA
ncbi:MAG: hypothetical protein ACRETL_05750 [Gammaproteobacteria bacterium]